jgi:chromosome segregation ATPase
MARRALELSEAAALVTAAVRGAAGEPRQVVAAAVAAAVRVGGDLLRESTCSQSEDAASEEVEARVGAIASMLEKQVRGLPVCGNTRLARNVASHVGIGNGAQALRGSVQEMKRQQRGARRGGKEKADVGTASGSSADADDVDESDNVKAKIQETIVHAPYKQTQRKEAQAAQQAAQESLRRELRAAAEARANQDAEVQRLQKELTEARLAAEMAVKEAARLKEEARLAAEQAEAQKAARQEDEAQKAAERTEAMKRSAEIIFGGHVDRRGPVTRRQPGGGRAGEKGREGPG